MRSIPRLHAVLLPCFLAAAAAFAQTTDYGRGFDRLDALGLPNARGARYVDLSHAYFPPEVGHGQYFMENELKLAGNSWLLEEQESGQARIIVGQNRIADIWELNKLQKLQREEARAAKGTNTESTAMFQRGMDSAGRVGGRWKNADPVRDAAKAKAWLDQQGDENERRNNWNLRQDGYGRLFLFSAHLYRAGHTNEANQLVAKLFEHAGSGQRVLIQAVGLLADAQYGEAYAAFRRTGDWNAFGEALRALLARFTSGWKTRGGVVLLEQAVARRVGGEVAPALEGEGITEEDRALLASLDAVGPEGAHWSGRTLWILPENEEERGFWHTPDEQPLAKVKARGLAIVPALLAMLEQDYLIAQPLESVRRGTYTSHDPSMAEEEKNAQEYRNMNRPATRAEVARHLLHPLLPGGERDGNWRRQPAEESIAEIRAWYEAQRERPLVDTAFSYLEEGDDAQKRDALDYLLAALPAERAGELEPHLIDEDDPDNTLERLRRYAEARGAAAKPLVEPYLARFDAGEFANEQHEGMPESYLAQRARQQSNRVERIRQALSGGSLEATLADFAAGKHPAEAAPNLIANSLKREKVPAAVALLVRSAASAQDPAIRNALLAQLNAHPRLMVLQHAMLAPEESVNAPWMAAMLKELAELDPAPLAEAWRVLLADDRVVHMGLSMGVSVAGDAAWNFERLNGQGHGREAYPLLMMLGRRGYDVLRERALARLDGAAPLPDIPRSSALTADARLELAARIAAAPESERADLLGGLTPVQLLCVVEDAATNAALNAALAPVANRITAVEFVGAGGERAMLESLSGERLERATLDRIIACALAEHAAGRAPTVAVLRKPAADGVVLRVFDTPPRAGRAQADVAEMIFAGMAATPPSPVVAVAYLPGGGRVSGSWGDRVAEPAGGPATAGAAAVDEDVLGLLDEIVTTATSTAKPVDEAVRNEEFWKRLEALQGGDASTAVAAAIHVVVGKAKPPAGD